MTVDEILQKLYSADIMAQYVISDDDLTDSEIELPNFQGYDGVHIQLGEQGSLSINLFDGSALYTFGILGVMERGNIVEFLKSLDIKEYFIKNKV